LKAQIHDELTAAMKAGEKVKVSALRMFVSAIRYKEDELRHELGDDEIREVAAKEVKKRTESIEAFEAAGRTDLVEKETAERDILEPYAPELLPESAVDALVEEAIAATGATSAKEMGKVMGFIMGRAKGKVDGGLVQRKVGARLAGE
jgi:hypothetical protein